VFVEVFSFMFLSWLKNYKSIIVTTLVTVAMIIYCYGCEAKVESLQSQSKLVNRQELQLELDTIITMAQLRMVDLDKQEQFKAIVLQNALILVEGQPFNPLGILTAVAAIYGTMQGGRNITKVVKHKVKKIKVDNG